MKAIAVLLVVLVLSLPTVVRGDSISGCSPAPSGAAPYTCNLYELDALGNLTESPPAVALAPGQSMPSLDSYVILVEDGDVQNQALGNWSDIVHFFLGPLDHKYVQLHSDPAEGFFDPADPFIVQVMQAPASKKYWWPEAGYPTVWMLVNDTYNIYSDPPQNENDIPEPATLLLAGAGLCGLALLKRRK